MDGVFADLAVGVGAVLALLGVRAALLHATRHPDGLHAPGMVVLMEQRPDGRWLRVAVAAHVRARAAVAAPGPGGTIHRVSNNAAQQRRRRARKRRGITLHTNRRSKLKPLSGWHYGKRKI